ncbi:adenine deaminase [Natronolimnohabitans innermongolicus]|uniref:Adenine deaminase n=1 Tax=Natronolimnohabitans innermongolicus JCM 12255 TaxID=1227499 RepID=L9WWZ4_9EURY|nr:adenine deaminase [Natronolimnohabitans innermongolicus]ELY53980.1 adenine deaminase [Natronolimnohabitans innermongolicus JCM 12255]
MEYVSTRTNGTLENSSQALAAVARGDDPPETIVRNGRLVNVHTGEIQRGMDLVIAAGRIARVTETGAVDAGPDTTEIDVDGAYLAPGFLDTHVHIESSMVTPTGFARGVVPTGTTGVFVDPHEIGNVLGLEGIRLLLDEGADLPLKTYCTIPSCVPAAPGFEDAGAEIDADDVAEALEWDEVLALGEMMNYPGVVHGDEEVHRKLAATYDAGVVATGHYASRDTGGALDAFVASGITACHESVRREEALEKLRRGVWTQLRQGSAWEDVPETVKAVTETDVDTRHLLLVTDDTHPDTIVEDGHLDRVLRVAIENGLDPVTAIQAVTLNAAEYYGVDADLGALSPGKIADVVVLEDLASVDVSRVLVDGELVAEDGELVDETGLPPVGEHTDALRERYPAWARETVALEAPEPSAFSIPAPSAESGESGGKRIDDPESVNEVVAEVCRVHENQVGTSREQRTLPVVDGTVELEGDVSKAFVFERHGTDDSVGYGFVSGFGFDRGAVASTVAHDSHNLLVVGTDDADMARAAERLLELEGGMVAVDDGEVLAEVALPIAGLMSDRPLEAVCESVAALEDAWEQLGCELNAPFMTMSLLALAVLPELRITNRGLVDTERFEFVEPVRPA